MEPGTGSTFGPCQWLWTFSRSPEEPWIGLKQQKNLIWFQAWEDYAGCTGRKNWLGARVELERSIGRLVAWAKVLSERQTGTWRPDIWNTLWQLIECSDWRRTCKYDVQVLAGALDAQWCSSQSWMAPGVKQVWLREQQRDVFNLGCYLYATHNNPVRQMTLFPSHKRRH